MRFTILVLKSKISSISLLWKDLQLGYFTIMSQPIKADFGLSFGKGVVGLIFVKVIYGDLIIIFLKVI